MGCARMRWDWACQRGRSPRRGAAPSRPSQAVMRGTATGYVVAGRAASSSARWETMMMMKACQAARAASARPRPRPQWRDFQPRSRLGAALALTHEGFPAPVLSIHPCSRACAPRRAGSPDSPLRPNSASLVAVSSQSGAEDFKQSGPSPDHPRRNELHAITGTAIRKLK